MQEAKREQAEAPLDLLLERANRINKELGHLAQAVEIKLIDVTLPPESTAHHEDFLPLLQTLEEITGISYVLRADISAATGLSLETEQEVSK